MKMNFGIVGVAAIILAVALISGCAQQNNAAPAQGTNNAGNQTPNNTDGGTVNQIPTNTDGGTVNQVPTNPDNPNPGIPQTGSASIQVRIENFAFTDGNLTVKAGDTVTWTNFDEMTHTITSDFGTELNSGSIESGRTYSHKFAQTGVYKYHCAFHESLKGTITVVE